MGPAEIFLGVGYMKSALIIKQLILNICKCCFFLFFFFFYQKALKSMRVFRALNQLIIIIIKTVIHAFKKGRLLLVAMENPCHFNSPSKLFLTKWIIPAAGLIARLFSPVYL